MDLDYESARGCGVSAGVQLSYNAVDDSALGHDTDGDALPMGKRSLWGLVLSPSSCPDLHNPLVPLPLPAPCPSPTASSLPLTSCCSATQSIIRPALGILYGSGSGRHGDTT